MSFVDVQIFTNTISSMEARLGTMESKLNDLFTKVDSELKNQQSQITGLSESIPVVTNKMDKLGQDVQEHVKGSLASNVEATKQHIEAFNMAVRDRDTALNNGIQQCQQHIHELNRLVSDTKALWMYFGGRKGWKVHHSDASAANEDHLCISLRTSARLFPTGAVKVISTRLTLEQRR